MKDSDRLEKWVEKALTDYDENHDGKLDIEET